MNSSSHSIGHHLMRCLRLAIYVFIVIAFTTFPYANVRSGLQKKAISASLPAREIVRKTPENSRYLPNRVIVKLRSSVRPLSKSARSFGVASLDKFTERYAAEYVKEIFPNHSSPTSLQQVDLTKFFVLRYSSPMDPFAVCKEISESPDVEYAEPWFVYDVQGVQGTPNDTAFYRQWDFKKVKVDSAWNITQGDTSVVLAIDDTGVQWDHPDLAGNIWNNPGETGLDGNGFDKRTNGIDDDGDGLIDDWHGWDFGGADYNNPVGDGDARPTDYNNEHGTHVAGITSAVTNNVTGVAGMGYKCKILPIKVTSDNDYRGDANGVGGFARIIFGYEGIIYAADVGAAAVNCSWGGKGYSQFEQDVINYAASLGTLVVAAAGNGSPGSNIAFYPASYANVISVAATDQNDAKTSYSNYGPYIDVCAPGGRSAISSPIYNTFYPNTYSTQVGTSMAAPHVTGLAGLVKSQFPSMDMLQVGQQIRVTCDDNSGINSGYIHQLGKGRINALRAVRDTSSPSLRVIYLQLNDSLGGNNNHAPEKGETIDLLVGFGNYLHATSSGAMITMSTVDTNVQILANTYPIGTVNELQIKTNDLGVFQFFVKNGIAPDRVVNFEFTMSDGSYNDYEVIKVALSPSYATQAINNLQVTFTKQGRIGFNDFDFNTQGVGLVYGNGNQLFEGGLIIGYSPTKIVDVVRNDLGLQDADFASSGVFTLQTPGDVSSQDGGTTFTDSVALSTNRIGLKVAMNTYAFANSPNRDFVLVRYNIKNTSGVDISNLYAGLFMDWDMLPPGPQQSQPWLTNRTSYDASRGLGYVWYDTTASTVYCGTRVLTGTPNYFGLHRDSAGAARADKWAWLSTGVHMMNATFDVHNVVSAGPFTLPNGSTQTIGFALVGGVGLSALQQHADAALAKWNDIAPLLAGRPRFTIAIHQNPAFTQYADMFVTVDSPLVSTPTLQIDNGGVLDTVTLSSLNSTTTYKGSYQFTSNGVRTIRVFAHTVSGLDTIVERMFNAQLLKAGVAQSIREPNGRAELNIPANAIDENAYFLAYKTSADVPLDSRLIGDVITFGPMKQFAKLMTVEFSYSGLPVSVEKEDYLHLFQRVDGEWLQLESVIDIQRKIVRSNVSILGELSVGIGMEPASKLVPKNFTLFQNYPNPFNPTTEIRFSLSERGTVRLRIYNIMGQEVLTLVHENRDAGTYQTLWDGKDMTGKPVASGMYFYRLDVMNGANVLYSASNKMIFLK